jgi:hypothetical protein
MKSSRAAYACVNMDTEGMNRVSAAARMQRIAPSRDVTAPHLAHSWTALILARRVALSTHGGRALLAVENVSVTTTTSGLVRSASNVRASCKRKPPILKYCICSPVLFPPDAC